MDEETENKETVEKVSPSERVPSDRVPSEVVRTETCQAMSTTVGKRAVNWETTMIESNNEVKLQHCIHPTDAQLFSNYFQRVFRVFRTSRGFLYLWGFFMTNF